MKVFRFSYQKPNALHGMIGVYLADSAEQCISAVVANGYELGTHVGIVNGKPGNVPDIAEREDYRQFAIPIREFAGE